MTNHKRYSSSSSSSSSSSRNNNIRSSAITKKKTIQPSQSHQNQEKDKNDLESNSTLVKCCNIISGLLKRRETLPPPPMDWIVTDHDVIMDNVEGYWQERIDIYRDIVSLTKAVELSVQTKRIQASSGRDIRNVTDLLGNILLICSESPPKRLSSVELPSTSQTCVKVLSLLEQLNLDVQNIHNFFSIRAAIQEHDWELSSLLFRKQIDPDVNGLVPVDSQLGWDGFLEMGLYGLAMDMIRRGDGHDGLDVVEGVLNAVSDMCLVSPTDEEKYMLAAGSALGRAGQWQGCVEYISRMMDSSEFHDTTFAAVLHACYLCKQYDVVIDLYRKKVHNFETGGGDWQWKGEYGRDHPFCLDLVLKSIGCQVVHSADKNQGYSLVATMLFHQIMEEGGRISTEAVRGVLRACENDADFGKAMGVLQNLVSYEEGVCDWTIVNESAENFLYENSPGKGLARVTKVIDDDIIATVMDTCNAAGESGLAILNLRTVGKSRDSLYNIDAIHSNSMVESLLHWQPQLCHSHRLLTSTIMALISLQCPRDARDLLLKSRDDKYFYPEALNNEDLMQTNICWNEAYRHMDRLLYAAECIQLSKQNTTQEEMCNLSLATGLMLRCAIDAGEAHAGLEVAKIVIPTFIRSTIPENTMKDTFKSFFGMNEKLIESNDQFWLLSDNAFAARMSAYRVMYGVDNALALFFSDNSPNGPKKADKGWYKTVNLVLDMLIEKEDMERAIIFFENMHPKDRGPETFAAIAAVYQQLEQFEKIAKLYVEAKNAGLLSEKLCFFAMEGIVGGNHQGKIKLLRSLVNDIAEMKGVKPGAWIADHYWTLKRRLGFHYARLLMWWNDPNETQRMEFRLATQHLQSRKKQGLNFELDALRCVIKLAKDQTLHTDETNAIYDPPSCVLDALIILCQSGQQNEVSLLLEGLTYLSNTGSESLAKEFLQFVKNHHITLDDKVTKMAEAASNISSKSRPIK